MAIENASPYEDKARISASSIALAETINDVTSTFNDTAITYNGDITGFDYTRLLRDKQNNIYDAYKLADYFYDAEELYGGAIKYVYVPFALIDGWYLTGGDDKVRAKYEEWFKRIGLDTKLESWFTQYFNFANIFFSLMEDGDLVTLPPVLTRVTNVTINGNPLIEFNARAVKQDLKKQGQKALKKYIDDEKIGVRLAGYPKEVTEALRKSTEWVQLDPKNTFFWSMPKPEWQRYAVPMIVMCLKPLAKKAIISKYEDALLNLAAASFVHASVGAPNDSTVVADANILGSVMNITKTAMKAGGGISVTNDWVKYEVIQPDVDKMFDHNKYSTPNEESLGAMGINKSFASGSNDTSVTFGAAQISTKIVSMRITRARQSFCELMNKIIRAVNGSQYGLPRSNMDKLPEFKMPVSDLTKVAAFQEACMTLWDKGMLSDKTLMDAHGFNVKYEYDQKKKEQEEGYDEVFVAHNKKQASSPESNKSSDDVTIGRPTMDDDERHSDPGNSETGAAPKPSSEEGSERQE